MDWNRNGKRDPADDIIDRKLSEAGKKPAEPPSARPRAAHIRFDIWLPLIYLGLLRPRLRILPSSSASNACTMAPTVNSPARLSAF